MNVSFNYDKMSKMRNVLMFCFVILTTTGFAQDEMTIGVRGGISWGPTFSISDGYKGFEGMLSFRERGIQATAVYLLQKPLENKHRLNLWFYYGVGLHLGLVRWKNWRYLQPGIGNPYWEYDWKTSSVAGVDGKFGVEYRFYSVPLIVGIDYKPFIELFGKQVFKIQAFDFALSIKYSIN